MTVVSEYPWVCLECLYESPSPTQPMHLQQCRSPTSQAYTHPSTRPVISPLTRSHSLIHPTHTHPLTLPHINQHILMTFQIVYQSISAPLHTPTRPPAHPATHRMFAHHRVAWRAADPLLRSPPQNCRLLKIEVSRCVVYRLILYVNRCK